MKRQITFALSLLMLLALTGCAGAPVEVPVGRETAAPVEGPSESAPTTQPQTLAPEQAYGDLVARFSSLVADPYSVSDPAEDGELGVMEAARALGDSAQRGLGYAIGDLSGDGIPELAVGALPEFGGQVYAVYTLVEGVPQFVFAGWYRNSYSYLGDGCFFYYGSCSAMETAQGLFALTEDATSLNCRDFYFTHAGDASDICVYYNTTGSWEPAESRQMDISPEDFFGWEPETEALPLIPFSGVAGTAPVHVQWGVPGLGEYEAMVVDDGEYSEEVLFTAEHAVTDFELVRLTVREAYDDGTVSFWTEPLCRLENLTPERPLVVRMTFPGDLPAYGVSYVDAQEDVHHLLLDISGKDGSLMLREEPDFWDLVPR